MLSVVKIVQIYGKSAWSFDGMIRKRIKIGPQTSVYYSFNHLTRLLFQGCYIKICKFTRVTRRRKCLRWK